MDDDDAIFKLPLTQSMQNEISVPKIMKQYE